MTKRTRLMINGIHVTASMKKNLVGVLDKHGPHWFDKDIWSDGQLALLAAGLLTENAFDEVALTEMGLEVAKEMKKEATKAREQRNANSRARNAVMSSLGMKRTPYGWE